MFKLGAFKAGSNRFEHREGRGLGIRCRTSIPAGRCEENHGTCRLGPNEASARVKARQAQTLRFFRLLRLLGPPQSSKPQRLLAASEPEPTLATDSVLGARHQLPSRADPTKRVDRNSLDSLTAHPEEYASNCTYLHCLYQNPSAPLIDCESCRGSRNAQKPRKSNRSSARFQHQESYPPRFKQHTAEDCPQIKRARTQNP